MLSLVEFSANMWKMKGVRYLIRYFHFYPIHSFGFSQSLTFNDFRSFASRATARMKVAHFDFYVTTYDISYLSPRYTYYFYIYCMPKLK